MIRTAGRNAATSCAARFPGCAISLTCLLCREASLYLPTEVGLEFPHHGSCTEGKIAEMKRGEAWEEQRRVRKSKRINGNCAKVITFVQLNFPKGRPTLVSTPRSADLSNPVSPPAGIRF
jgi:hypothetical protein